MTNEKKQKLMVIARSVADLSKDTSTKVGAIVIGPTSEGMPWGYNGAARGCSADEAGDDRMDRPEKYFWMVHAEANAIFTAARRGVPLLGSTMVVTHFPCMACANAIVQAGIVRVITQRPEPEFLERWSDHVSRSLRLFDECGVEVEYV